MQTISNRTQIYKFYMKSNKKINNLKKKIIYYKLKTQKKIEIYVQFSHLNNLVYFYVIF